MIKAPFGTLLAAQRYVDRLAIEMLHQGAVTLELRSPDQLRLLRNDSAIADRSIPSETMQLLMHFLPDLAVEVKGVGHCIWLAAGERVLEAKLLREKDDTSLRVEVLGVTTTQSLLDEWRVAVPLRGLLGSASSEPDALFVLTGVSVADTQFLSTLFRVAANGISVDGQTAEAWQRGTSVRGRVGVLIGGIHLSNYSSLISLHFDNSRGWIHCQCFPGICPHCTSKQRLKLSTSWAKFAGTDEIDSYLAAGCEACRGLGEVGIVPVLVGRLFNAAVTSGQQGNPLVPPLPEEASFCQALLDNVREGKIAPKTLLSVEPPTLAAMESLTSPAASVVAPSSNPPVDKLKILVVEDDQDQRAILEVYLKKSGYEIHSAEDGVRGLAVLGDLDPDLIITDLMMPNMDGAEFIRQVRRDARFAAVPILVLTVVDDDDREFQALELGADDYCEKTMQRKLLVKRIEKLLDRRR